MQTAKKTLYKAKKIITMDKDCPCAEAMLINNGVIEALGTAQELTEYTQNSKVDILDVQDKIIYPGFIETHSHIDYYAVNIPRVFCGLKYKNIGEVLEALKERAKQTEEGEWIVGYSYDDTGLAEQRHLTKDDLDKVSTKHPILVFHISGHVGYINSYAIKKLHLLPTTTVEGGVFVKNEQGDLNGILEETALFTNMYDLPEPDFDTYCQLLQQAMQTYNKCGITTCFIGGIGIASDPEKTMKALLHLERKNKLTARAYLQFVPDVMKDLVKYSLFHCGSDFIKFGGLKWVIDGSIQCMTAALTKGYHTKPEHKSQLFYTVEEIEKRIEEYHLKDIQIAVHTNGDYASEVAITAFEKAYQKHPVKLNHMLIHAQNVSEEHLDRMKAIGIIPSFYGYHIHVWGDRHANIFLGKERTCHMDPAGSAARRDMPFSLHMDTPILPMTVLDSMQTAVTRESSTGQVYGEDQKITPYQALQAYTTYAAKCAFWDHAIGMLKVNFKADFVVLDHDLETIEPHTIKNTRVCMTVCNGKVVYKA